MAPVDWGVSDVRGKRKAGACLVLLSRLFDRYHPDILLLRDTLHKSRCSEFRGLLEQAERLAAGRGVVSLRVSRDQVKAAFADLAKPTRQATAEAIAQRIPMFAPLLPPARKIWNGEDRRMGLFDAAALALAFFHRHGAEPGVT